MQTSHARTIRGLSIAVVILSVLSILGLIFSLAFIGVSGAALGSEEVRGAASYSLSMDPDSAYTMEQLGITEDDAFGMLGFLLGLGAVYVFWGIICSIVTLIAGIIGMRNYDKTDKLGKVFGWSIAGAVMAFFVRQHHHLGAADHRRRVREQGSQGLDRHPLRPARLLLQRTAALCRPAAAVRCAAAAAAALRRAAAAAPAARRGACPGRPAATAVSAR